MVSVKERDDSVKGWREMARDSGYKDCRLHSNNICF